MNMLALTCFLFLSHTHVHSRTKPDNLSEVCKDKLPKKEEKAERKLSPAEQMKADRRRKARKEAANRVKKDL